MKNFASRMFAFVSLAFVLQLLVSLEWSKGASGAEGRALVHLPGLLSVNLPPTNPYRPDAEVLQFQSMMTGHPKLGFLFKPNLGQAKNPEAVPVGANAWQVTTDEFGFVNLAKAIVMRREGRSIDVAAVGSSFTQGAAGTMHDYFAAQGLFYYNLGNPRHTYPQFTVVAKDYAAPLRPRWILYEINEPGFGLIEDYESWLHSGFDWFAYHSGTWCGPPTTAEDNWLTRRPTLLALYRGVNKRLGIGVASNKQASKERAVAKAFNYVMQARRAAEEQGIGFVALSIPSRERASKGESARWDWVERLAEQLRASAVDVVDLATVFGSDQDPRRLYHRVDAHWNDQGMVVAARSILLRLRQGNHRPSGTTASMR